MINTIKKILGIGPKVDYAEMVRNGAIIIDVRSKGEYSHGHIKDSLNIPIKTPRLSLSQPIKCQFLNKYCLIILSYFVMNSNCHHYIRE